MTTSHVVAVVLLVLVAIAFTKRVGRALRDWCAQRFFRWTQKHGFCEHCLTQDRKLAPADYEGTCGGVTMNFCDRHVRAQFTRPGMLEWAWNKGILRRLER